MADSPRSSDDLLPSLGLVRAELDREQDALERRAAQLDSRAGLLLAAAGVFVALRAARPTLLDVLAQTAAAAAGACAVWSLWPRVSGVLSPWVLRQRYLHRPEAETMLVVLDTRMRLLLENETALRRKLRRLRCAVFVLTLAAILALTGSIVSFLLEEHR